MHARPNRHHNNGGKGECGYDVHFCHGLDPCTYKPTVQTIAKQTIAMATQKPDSFIPYLFQ
jgi:hypothetical protein